MEEDEDCSLGWSLGDNVDEDEVSYHEPVNVEVELEQFRSQWQKELHRRKENTGGTETSGSDRQQPTIEDQARYLFMQGVNAEQSGRLYDAIKYYRRAIQLVPDIEFRMKDYIPRVRRRSQRTDSESSLGACSESSEVEDLMEHFSQLQTDDDDAAICQKKTQSLEGHLSDLPWEIIMYILKWVVSTDLDIPSLENFSEVCRGFYVCGRDEELWKLICQRVYGKLVGRPGMYGSYRNMYLQKPRIHCNGCYISRLEYFRQGEQGLDGFYRPIHIVEYFRYVRFFPDGEMLMLTTPDNPYVALSKLRHKGSKIQGILHGYYKISGDRVSAMLKRRRVPDNNQYQYRYKYRRQIQNTNDSDQSFQLELTVRSAGRRQHCQLVWKHYAARTYYRKTGQEQETEFDLTPKNYPPMIFSRVKSYTAVSEAPLA